MLFFSYLYFLKVIFNLVNYLKDRFFFYLDKRNKWRWRVISVNGLIVGSSSQGYFNKLDCLENAKRFFVK